MMLHSTLRSAAAGIGVVALTVTAAIFFSQADHSEYQPRPEVAQTEPDGAFEIRRMLLGDENGNIDYAGLQRLRHEVVKLASKQTERGEYPLSWHELGPDNIGGRTRAIVAVGMNTLYAGAVSGGLWKSTNQGDNWTQVTSYPNLMVGSIAVTGDGTIYVGSGSVFDYDGGGGAGSSGFPGEGIWMSNDNGVSFKIVPGTEQYEATDALVADPRPEHAGRVWVASMGGYGYITDGELTELGGSGVPSLATDMAVAPDGSYCLVVENNARVWRSVAGDFSNLEEVSALNGEGTLPFGMARARVDIAQTETGDGYNAFVTYANNQRLFGGLWFSGSEGEPETWEEVWPGGITTSTPLPYNQGVYDLALGISKSNPKLAFVGGVQLWRSGPEQQAESAAAAIDFPGCLNCVHADVHEIIFVEDSSTHGIMYIATDGGIYRSYNNGATYEACNRDYNVTQFYGMAHSAGSGVLGGTQDNGSLFIPGDGYFLSDQMAVEVQGGDGFDCAISQVTEANGYNYAWVAASQNGGVRRGTLAPGEVNNTGDFYDDNFTDLFNSEGELGQFYTCLRLYEDFNDTSSQNHVILVNSFGQDTIGGSFQLETASQNLPFSFEMGPDETLHHYDVLARPERILDAPLTEDPDYFWLDPQSAEEEIVCEVVQDSIGVDTVAVATEVIVTDTLVTEYIEETTGDTVTVYTVIDVPTGVYDTTFNYVTLYDEYEVCETLYVHAADTLYDIPEQLMVQDPYNSMFVLGLNGNLGVWMTREALNFNTTPSWIRIADSPGGQGVKAIEFVETGEHAGDVMFFTSWGGQVYRVSGLRDVYSQEDVEEHVEVDELLEFTGAAVTGLSIDPNDASHVVISLGGYGAPTQGKVRETTNAMASSVSWTNIWNVPDSLKSMPCYDVVVDALDDSGSSIVLGTEFGVFVTSDGGDSWTISNAGMAADTTGLTAPVFDLKQQFRSSHPWSEVTNGGAIYAATHGRGMFVNGILSDVDEPGSASEEVVEQWNVFPNPVFDADLNLPTAGWLGNAQVEIFDMTGRRWLNTVESVSGVERISVSVDGLPSGQYVVRMSQGKQGRAAIFVVQH